MRKYVGLVGRALLSCLGIEALFCHFIATPFCFHNKSISGRCIVQSRKGYRGVVRWIGNTKYNCMDAALLPSPLTFFLPPMVQCSMYFHWSSSPSPLYISPSHSLHPLHICVSLTASKSSSSPSPFPSHLSPASIKAKTRKWIAEFVLF